MDERDIHLLSQYRHLFSMNKHEILEKLHKSAQSLKETIQQQKYNAQQKEKAHQIIHNNISERAKEAEVKFQKIFSENQDLANDMQILMTKIKRLEEIINKLERQKIQQDSIINNQTEKDLQNKNREQQIEQQNKLYTQENVNLKRQMDDLHEERSKLSNKCMKQIGEMADLNIKNTKLLKEIETNKFKFSSLLTIKGSITMLSASLIGTIITYILMKLI
jgi:DNA repair exonuclease SbcCD ATPase subunit